MKLTAKLAIAFLLVSLTAIGLAAVFVWSATAFEFNRYLQDQRQAAFAAAAEAYYAQNNHWQGVDRALQQQGFLPPPLDTAGPPGQKPPAPPFALLDANRVVITPAGNLQRGEKAPADASKTEIVIKNNGSVVGIVLRTGAPLVQNQVERQYINQISLALLIAALGGALIALVLGLFVARTLTRPLKELTRATRALASNQHNQPVPVRSNDELGELAGAFNQMSADLARANQSRRQMTADIAHDLRNPLTVIGGYLESLRDGVLKPTPERFETMHTEVQHLQRMVEDLRTLSLADAGELHIQRAPASVAGLLTRAATTYQHQASQQNITLTVQAAQNLPPINIDSERMEQVLGNLVSNALRYTPDGGEIVLAATPDAGGVLLSVSDTGSGIQPEALIHIFERSYRADPSRAGNESGLGLAIAKSIVEAHGGNIRAESKPGAGSRFLIHLSV
jgi:signal transduction histidine kinase